MLQTEILEGIYHHHGKFDLGLEITLVPDCNYVSCSTTPSAPFYLQVQSNSQTTKFLAEVLFLLSAVTFLCHF